MPPKKRDVKAQAKAQDVQVKAAKVKDEPLKIVSTSAVGGVFVDHMIPQAPTYKVISDQGKPLSCYLMWSDIKDNHNKFYIAQGLQNSAGTYFFWTRYGRVGLDGVGTNQQCGSLNDLLGTYNKKYREKTNKGYTVVKMAIGKDPHVEVTIKEAKNVKKTDVKMPKSKLDENLQALISFIFDMSLMEQSVVQIGYDAKRLPLGQLDKETVMEGYKYLREIEKVLSGKVKGDLADLSSKFYTYIPHNFSMKHMSNFTIKTVEQLREKLDLIQNLTDIQIAHKIMNPTKPKDLKVNPIDENYKKLKCEMKTLKSESEEFKMIEQFLENSKDGRKLKLLDAFSMKREGESKRFNPQKLDNKILLWHGSRFSNFVGIISQGLRIAPPEAPKTGYLFGKGVYFADLAGKSAPYCCADLSNNVGLFMLCEVALGKPRELYMPDHDADILPKGFNSTQCVGRLCPNPQQHKILEKDITVPYGKVVESKDKDVRRTHNEFIVYSVDQIQMRYLVKAKFN